MGNKVKVNLFIDKEVVERAKEMGLNLSVVSERALIRATKALESEFKDNTPSSSSFSGQNAEWWTGRDLNPRPLPCQGSIHTN